MSAEISVTEILQELNTLGWNFIPKAAVYARLNGDAAAFDPFTGDVPQVENNSSTAEPPPILQALELLDQWYNYSCLTDYIADAQYPDIRERSEKVSKALQKWVDYVPSIDLAISLKGKYTVENNLIKHRAAKHLLKGISND